MIAAGQQGRAQIAEEQHTKRKRVYAWDVADVDVEHDVADVDDVDDVDGFGDDVEEEFNEESDDNANGGFNEESDDNVNGGFDDNVVGFGDNEPTGEAPPQPEL